MDTRKWMWCACAVHCTGVARAQETVTLDIRFADPLLTPGESQHIEVWGILEPGIGATAIWNTNGGTGQLGEVWGIAGAKFDFTSVSNGHTGSFSGLTLNPEFVFTYPPPSPGVPDGEGNVRDVAFVLSPDLGAIKTSNPVLLWSCEWTPTGYVPRTIGFTTQVMAGPDVFLRVNPNGFLAEYDTWTGISPSASFQVVPAPGSALLLGLGLLPLSRRRRRDDGV